MTIRPEYTLAEGLATAAHDVTLDELPPVAISVALNNEAARIARTIDPDTACALRLREVAAECRAMLLIADRLTSRPNNDRRSALDRWLCRLENAADRADRNALTVDA